MLRAIMADEASEIEIAGFLMALRAKGESVDEVAGLARTMRELATPVDAGRDDLLDTAGTGGGRSTFNISTTAALIAAGAGCAVAKHGNRSATSLCGSADLLEALGARIELAPEAVAECIREVGFGFMFAPRHHQATRFVVPVRRELAVRTIFNFLGPLTNPAGATRQLVGVSDPAYLDTIAGALARLGVGRALVVCSDDGLDEMSIAGATRVVEVSAQRTERYVVVPDDVGLATAASDALAGGAPDENAATTRAILAGEAGPRRDVAALNAGAAIYAAGRAGSLSEGVRAAETAIDDGAAAAAAGALRGLHRAPRAGMSVLDRIVESTRHDLARRRAQVPQSALEHELAARGEDRPFSEAVARPGMSLIAEHKRRSPSAGEIRAGSSVAEVVRAYERGGAAALSILTEAAHFGGSLDDLREARAASSLPLLRKDFIVDVYQVYESAAAGADAMLLIVAALAPGDLRRLHEEALGLDLDVLVEVHDEPELQAALELGAEVIGINNRDLTDFSVNTDRTVELLSDVPAGKAVVSESGYWSRDQLDELDRIGVDAVLIGESLLRADDVEAACRELTGSGDRAEPGSTAL